MSAHAKGSRDQKRRCSSQGSMFDDMNRKIPRPMNAFMIFAAENRANFKEEYPDENNKDISVRLGEAWRKLSKVQRDSYFKKAKDEEKEHKKKYPNYVYCPGVARQRKRERLAEKARLDAILKAEIDSVLSETRSRKLGENLLPMSGYMGGSNSPGSLQDMNLYSFGQPYPQAGTPGVPMQMFPSPQGTGYSPYRQGHAAPASTCREQPYPLRERCMTAPHYPQPMSHSMPYYSSSYGQMRPGGHPRQITPLHRQPYPYPMQHGRPPYMMQRAPVGHYQHFDRAHQIEPGMMYRPWQPQFHQGQTIGESLPFEREADETSSHSIETISHADSTDDTRQHCTTPSDTSQEAQPEVALPVQQQTWDSASPTQKLEDSDENKPLPGMQTFIQIPIYSSNPDGTSESAQQEEQSANDDDSKSTLLSLNGPPYNFVMAHYPQSHFGNPDKRLQRGEAHSFSVGSDTFTSVPFGNGATSAASDFVGVPQFYAMKRTPKKPGESRPEMMMSPIRLEQPFFTDGPANQSSPFNTKHLPNEFIEQIAKQFYLLQGQGGEKFLQSPIVITSPRLGPGQHSSPARLFLSPARLVSVPTRLVQSPTRVPALCVSDPEHPVPASVGSFEEKLPAASADIMEVKEDNSTVPKAAATSVDQISPAASPKVKVHEDHDQVSVASNEEKPPAAASSAMEVNDVFPAPDDHKSPPAPIDENVDDLVVPESRAASKVEDETNSAGMQENSNAIPPTKESVGSCEEKLPAASADIMEVKVDNSTVPKAAAATVEQRSPAASPKVKEHEDQVYIASNEEKPPAAASSAMEVNDDGDPMIPEAGPASDDHKSPAEPIGENDNDIEITDRAELIGKVHDEAASIDDTDMTEGEGPSDQLHVRDAPFLIPTTYTDDAFASDQTKGKIKAVSATLEGPLKMITHSSKDVLAKIRGAKTTPDRCGDGPQLQREPV